MCENFEVRAFGDCICFRVGPVSHALDPSAENLSLPVILLIVGRKLKYKGLQQEKTNIGFPKDKLLPCRPTEPFRQEMKTTTLI